MNRGTLAAREAYGYIKAGKLYRTRWGRRRAAFRYLVFAASPPLSYDEEQAARAEMKRQR